METLPSSGTTDPALPKIGLALAGGGPGGAIYEIGALCALDEALEGVDFNDLYAYVGVSAGACLAACLANDITPARLCRSLITDEASDDQPFSPETFFTPHGKEFLHRASMLPRLFYEALRNYWSHKGDMSLLDSMTRLSRALPVGVFANEPVRRYLEKVFAREGRTDDFRELRKRLTIVAADLDSGEAVRFGEEGMRHIPISRAVQASSALPGLYPPVEIEGRYYVDGALLKTMHASVALEAGTELLLCINPIVPVDTARAVERGAMKRGKLIDRGLPGVLSQTFRTLIRSRLQVGMNAYESRFGDAEVILFEPPRDDYKMFFSNIFSFRERQEICEHAYQQTRQSLLWRWEDLEPKLARHGVRMRGEVLEDPARTLLGFVDGQASQDHHRPVKRKDLSVHPVPLVQRLNRALTRLDTLLEGAEAPRQVAPPAGPDGKLVAPEAVRAPGSRVSRVAPDASESDAASLFEAEEISSPLIN